jgi:hypothetical protein
MLRFLTAGEAHGPWSRLSRAHRRASISILRRSTSISRAARKVTGKGIAYDREDVIPVNVRAEYKKVSPLSKSRPFATVMSPSLIHR